MYIKLAIICIEMKLYSIMFTDPVKGPRTEPWGTPDRSLQTSDKVKPIFTDW